MDADRTTAAQRVDLHEVDLDGAAFAARLANLLANHRRESGDRLQTIARRSNGRFTARQLRAFESGQGSPIDAAEVTALYGADLATILPARLPIEIDETGRVSTAGVSESFGAGDQDALLIAYLRLIRRLRHQQRAEVVDLRRDDVEILAATLDLPGETIVDRLGQLMGATRVERRIMVGMFVAGAAIIGLTVTTVAATSGGGDDGGTSPVPTDPPAAGSVADTTVAVTTTASGTLVDDLPAEPPVRPRPVGTPLPDIAVHQSMAFLEANGAFLAMPDVASEPPPADDVPDTVVPAPPTTADPGDAPATPPPATQPPATSPPATPAPTTTEPDVATGPPPVPTTEAPIVEPPPTQPTSPTTSPPATPAPTTTEPDVATGPPPVPPTTSPIP